MPVASPLELALTQSDSQDFPCYAPLLHVANGWSHLCGDPLQGGSTCGEDMRGGIRDRAVHEQSLTRVLTVLYMVAMHLVPATRCGHGGELCEQALPPAS